ncbi:MAG: ATP synthase F1 subunit delta [Flavobacteriales bacterium]|nr:ATP synthase F1 subunit delta [Flavobacteriales bacterium]|tara:strand:+ start:4837 stop:5394 length:558 start_codon:yes stop_codon:yes gene_type:complete
MAYARAAARYAKSIIQLSIEQGELDLVKADMDLIRLTCAGSKELVLLLESPVVRPDKKMAVLKAVFGSQLSNITSKFLQILMDKGRESLIDDISYAFEDQFLAHNNILRTVIKSVDGLNDDFKFKVKQLVKSAYDKDVEIIEEKDPSLIGGFVLTIGDKQVDASISRKLAELEKEFSKNTYMKDY